MTATRALVAAAAAAMLWGSIGIVIRLAERSGGSVDVLIVGRAVGGTLLSLPLLAYYRARPSRWSLAIALLGLAPLYYTYMKAVSIVGAAIASLLLYTAPLWVTMLGLALLGERPGARGATAVVLGVVGAALVSGLAGGPAGGPSIEGIAYGLSSGLAYALYIVLARLAQRRGATTLEASLQPVALTGLLLLVALRPARPPNTIELAASAYLAVFTIIIPYILHVYALKHVEAHRVSIISLLEPLSAVTLAHIILGERLDARQLAGATLIITSAITTSINTSTTWKRQHKTTK